MLITKDTSFMFSSHSVAFPISQRRATLATFSTDDSFCSVQAHKEVAGEAESPFHRQQRSISLGPVAHGQEMSEYLQQTYKQCN